MKPLLLASALALLPLAAWAQSQPDDWQARAMVFRAQRDQANDALAQLKVEADRQIAADQARAAALAKYWADYVKGLDPNAKPAAAK